MIRLYDKGIFLLNGNTILPDEGDIDAQLKAKGINGQRDACRKGTIAYDILQKHNTSGNDAELKLRFDAMASHDITYVGIVQTARASGLTRFPMPYVLTNCHNTLCAVGGTINEDDHVFGLSAAKKYGGIFVPPHIAVIHQYMREMHAGCKKMILGSDSHTRYGAIGTMAIGEGGGELAKQLLNKTYDVTAPDVVAVYLKGSLPHGVGPQDVALAIIGAVFDNGFVKNKVMEFVGEGISGLSMDTRNGIDVMTTETTCLSSIWVTDEKTKDYLSTHGRIGDYEKLAPADCAYYDSLIEVDLSAIKPMIALPMHPSNVYTIDDLRANLTDILAKTEKDCAALTNNMVAYPLLDKIKNGKLVVDQGVIAGCAGGTYENIMAAYSILNSRPVGCDEYALSVYPSSQPVMMKLVENGAIASLMASGATIRSAFCGPCFGAGDVPSNGSLSIRHTTRNFPSREGSKPSGGQMAGVALMDARSVAATSLMGGVLTGANEIDYTPSEIPYTFINSSYTARVFQGFGKGEYDTSLKLGPNIKSWPDIFPLPQHIALKVACFIDDPLTTTDELIPSGETSSYRSNPLGLAEFTLSRKDPDYVPRAKSVAQLETQRREGNGGEILSNIQKISGYESLTAADFGIGSTIYAVKPGDGSAREQAASCQRVLGAGANIAREYATKRYRSNLINWGMLPFIINEVPTFTLGDVVFVPNIRKAIENATTSIDAFILGKAPKQIQLSLAALTHDEREILLDGCLINYYKE